MNGVGDHVFAYARFPRQHHGTFGRRHLPDLLHHPEVGPALAGGHVAILGAGEEERGGGDVLQAEVGRLADVEVRVLEGSNSYLKLAKHKDHQPQVSARLTLTLPEAAFGTAAQNGSLPTTDREELNNVQSQ